MTNIKQKIKEVEKGCGKKWNKSSVKDEYSENYQYGEDGDLCPSCQIKLQTLKSCEEEI